MFENKIKGCIFGYAIGDALGLGTEFMTRQEAKVRYPDGLREYKQIIRDAHRSQWRKGDYTADTRFIEILAESMIEKSDIDHLDYARRLKEWYETSTDFDCGPHLRLIIQDPDFAKDPIATAQRIYTGRGHDDAHNEALGRALLLGLWPNFKEEHVIQNCKMTHPNSRCVTSAVVIGVMAHELLWYRREAKFDLLMGIAKRLDETVIPYLETARSGSLADFSLDDEETFWYSRKAMGAALWTLWHHDNPETALYNIIEYAGDADTNAALALGLLGLKYGYNHLPQNLIETLLEKDKLNNLSDRLISTLKKSDKHKDTDE